MPNHVTHRVVVTGNDADIRAFTDRCIITTRHDATEHQPERQERNFDFNSLIPMPEELRNVSAGSTMEWGLMLIGRPDLARSYYTIDQMLQFPWVKDAGVATPDELRALLVDKHPKIIAEGEAAAARHDKYGALSWYDWSIENWGTKWNSYDYNVVSDEPGRLEFTFDTAWSTPDPIWTKLAADFPGLLFEIHAFDEGYLFAITGELRDGENYLSCVDATDELYEATYGRPPEKFDDENDDVDADELTSDNDPTSDNPSETVN